MSEFTEADRQWLISLGLESQKMRRAVSRHPLVIQTRAYLWEFSATGGSDRAEALKFLASRFGLPADDIKALFDAAADPLYLRVPDGQDP